MNKDAFDGFHEFNVNFNNKYEYYKRKYPYMFMLVEKDLRHRFASREGALKENVKGLSEFSVHKLAYKVYFIVSVFVFGYKKKEIICLPKFPKLASSLSGERCAYGCFGSLKALLFLKHVRILSLPVQRRVYRKFFLKLINKDIDDISEICLDNVDRSVRSDILFWQKILSRMETEMIVSEFDSGPAHRIIIEAARLAGVKYNVIAHGYIQDPFLVTVAPIYADKLFVWTELQRKLISKALIGLGQEKKVIYKGSPVSITKKDRKSFGRCLLALEPFPDDCEDLSYFCSVLNRYIDALHSAGFVVIVRFHPKDSDRRDLLLPGLIYSKSDIEIYEVLDEVDFVVFTNTSVSLQAAFSGIPAVQIKELAKLDFEYSMSLEYDEFSEVLKTLEFSRPISNVRQLSRSDVLLNCSQS